MKNVLALIILFACGFSFAADDLWGATESVDAWNAAPAETKKTQAEIKPVENNKPVTQASQAKPVEKETPVVQTPVNAEKKVAADTVKPAPVAVDKPVPVDTVKSAPMDTAKTVAVDSVKSASIDSVKQAPVVPEDTIKQESVDSVKVPVDTVEVDTVRNDSALALMVDTVITEPDSVGVIIFEPVYTKDSTLPVYAIDDSVITGNVALLEPGVHRGSIIHPCYDPVEFKIGVDAFDTLRFSETLNYAVGGVNLSATWNGAHRNVPVFVDGMRVGETPYGGEVRLCSSIAVGDSMEPVSVKIPWHAVVDYEHVLKNNPEPIIVVDSASRDSFAEEPKKEPSKMKFKRFMTGLHFAGALNSWYGDQGVNDQNYLLSIGGNAGIAFMLNFGDYFATTLGADFGYRRVASESASSGDDLVTSLMNIDVPLGLRVRPFTTHFYIELGPMVSFNVNASETVDDLTENVSEFFNLVEFDAFGGLGFTVSVFGKPLDVGAKAVMGLTNLPDKDAVGDEYDCKTMQYSLNVTFWAL